MAFDLTRGFKSKGSIGALNGAFIGLCVTVEALIIG
jgi:hypothetical protein